jgi:hypothetical protein
MKALLNSLWQMLKRWWMKFAAALGWCNTRLLLTVLYLLLFGVAAIIIKIIRKDLLRKKPTPGKSYWIDKDPVAHTTDHARHQF